MKLENVLVSVGRTWRFDTGGQTGVDLTKNRYAKEINRLKGVKDQSDFRLPWPQYRSRFWRYMLSPSYWETGTNDLVAVLLPLQYVRFFVDTNTPVAHPRVDIEAIRHPFALTTIAHFRLKNVTPWPSDEQAALLLNTLTRGNVGVMQPVDGGFPYQVLPSLPTQDVLDTPIAFQNAGQFTVISALHRDTDPLLLASTLARHFPSNPTPDGSAAIHDGAMHVHGDTAGFAVSAQVGANKAKCLHHNYTALLAYLQNLATLVVSNPTPEGQWYQDRAVTMLNHLYRAEPAPPMHSVYKSRLTELWLNERSLIEPINQVAQAQGLGLPPLQPPLTTPA